MQMRFRDVNTGEVFTVAVKVNYEEIARRLATRARRSKNGKARALDGAIVCELVPNRD